MKSKIFITAFALTLMVPLACASKEKPSLIVENFGDNAVSYAIPNCENTIASAKIHIVSRTMFQKCPDARGNDGLEFYSIDTRQKLGRLEVDKDSRRTNISAETFVIGSAENPFGLVAYSTNRMVGNASLRFGFMDLRTGAVSYKDRSFGTDTFPMAEQVGSCLAIRYAIAGSPLATMEIYDVNSEIDPADNMPRVRGKIEADRGQRLLHCQFFEEGESRTQKIEVELVSGISENGEVLGYAYESLNYEVTGQSSGTVLNPQKRSEIRRRWAEWPVYVQQEVLGQDLHIRGQNILALRPDKFYASWTAPFLNVKVDYGSVIDASYALLGPVGSNKLRFVFLSHACRNYECYRENGPNNLLIVDCKVECSSKLITKLSADYVEFRGSDTRSGKIYLVASFFSAPTTKHFPYDFQSKLIEVKE
ncbi:hypothetical protein [Aquidulcibacter sp.]|uniref:hypothetical protein n=1 Tax=Aquidulcibacter sp. TaxID=2052990 RepID=UPI0025BF28CA|nr:hypothetical protein [Aquidulcibacter sp.]MCA3692692.1 hypothetical protein [Aquidulcibacter sp.]